MNYNFDKIIDRNNTDCYKYDLRNRFFKTDDIIPMWVADMDFSAPDFIIEALKARLDHDILGYTTRNEEFFDSIVNWVKRRHGWKINKEWIGFTPGVVPAINLAINTFSSPGDKIIIQTPVYFPFFSAVRDHGRQLIENKLILENGRYHMDIDHLKKNIDKKTTMLILCSPHNPTGNVWKEEELKELVNLCIENNILIISDEIHADIVMPGHRHIPTARLSEEISDHVITLMAPSKTFNIAGLSTSYFISSNQDLYQKMNSTIQQMHLNMGNIFGNIALTTAYNEGEEWLDQLIAYLQQNITYVKEFINSELKNIELINPEATFLLWIDFRKTNLQRKKLNDILIKNVKVGLSEGQIFGENGAGFQRMNIGCPKSILEKAMHNLASEFKA